MMRRIAGMIEEKLSAPLVRFGRRRCTLTSSRSNPQSNRVTQPKNFSTHLVARGVGPFRPSAGFSFSRLLLSSRPDGRRKNSGETQAAAVCARVSCARGENVSGRHRHLALSAAPRVCFQGSDVGGMGALAARAAQSLALVKICSPAVPELSPVPKVCALLNRHGAHYLSIGAGGDPARLCARYS